MGIVWVQWLYWGHSTTLPVPAPSLTLINVEDFNQWMDEEPPSLASFQVFFISSFIAYSVPGPKNVTQSVTVNRSCFVS